MNGESFRPNPRTGDLVRAVRANRAADEVTGVLHLRHIPSLGYVQVTVRPARGQVSVDPASIEVIEKGVMAIGALEAMDPLLGHPGWKRIEDLDTAMREGLIRRVERDGLSWDDLLIRMRAILLPLVECGWEVSDEDTDEGSEDCVVCALRRGDTNISVDHYPNGWTIFHLCDEQFFSLHDEDEIQLGPGWPVEPTYRSLGWLGTPDD